MQIQARLYWRIIRANLDKDPYFKDFKLCNYLFIVVNKKTLTPLVWECPFTKETSTLYFGKNKQIELRDPERIGMELNYYLNKKPDVPVGISKVKANNLKDWIDKL